MHARYLAIFCVAALIAAPAHADPFCDALGKVLASAPAGLGDLRGALDSDDRLFTVWVANLSLPGTVDCEVQISKPGPDDLTASDDYLYSCGIPVTAGATRAITHAETLAKVKACLPGAEVTGYRYDTNSDGVDYVHAQNGIIAIHDGSSREDRVILQIQKKP